MNGCCCLAHDETRIREQNILPAYTSLLTSPTRVRNFATVGEALRTGFLSDPFKTCLQTRIGERERPFQKRKRRRRRRRARKRRRRGGGGASIRGPTTSSSSSPSSLTSPEISKRTTDFSAREVERGRRRLSCYVSWGKKSFTFIRVKSMRCRKFAISVRGGERLLSTTTTKRDFVLRPGCI